MKLGNREGDGAANASTDQPKPIVERQRWTAGPLGDPRFHLPPTHIGRVLRHQARDKGERRPGIAGCELKAYLLFDELFIVRAEPKQPPPEFARNDYPIRLSGQRGCPLENHGIVAVLVHERGREIGGFRDTVLCLEGIQSGYGNVARALPIRFEPFGLPETLDRSCTVARCAHPTTRRGQQAGALVARSDSRSVDEKLRAETRILQLEGYRGEVAKALGRLWKRTDDQELPADRVECFAPRWYPLGNRSRARQ
jgi:hypothetical protein